MLRGQQVAYEILEEMAIRFDYYKYLTVSKEYIDSQQHPTKIIEEPHIPSKERQEEKPLY